MTNPAVEALKPCAHCGHSEPLYNDYGSDGKMVACPVCKVSTDFWPTEKMAFENWNRRAQAEQAPVAGRVVSEELWAYLVEYCEASQPLVALCTKSGETPRLLKNLEALRAAPTVRKGEES